ncbi:MAG: hypothetical protein OXC46_04520 [Thaumarchaeota archaeon]|nr:hypothetical protein [Nitrososphaerota archaeon]
MKPVIIAGILAVFVVLVASPVIAQEEITDSLQSILDGLQAEITELTSAGEQRDQQLADLDTRLSNMEVGCFDGRVLVEGVCLSVICPAGYSLSGNECVADTEPITDPEPIDPEPVKVSYTYYSDGTVKTKRMSYDNGKTESWTKYRIDGSIEFEKKHYYNGNEKSETRYYPNGSIEQQMLYDENRNMISWTDYYPDGSMKTQSLYEYYGNGVKKSKITNYPDGSMTSYMFDENGLLEYIVRYYPDGSMESETLYDDNGKYACHISYNPDGTESHRYNYLDGTEC